MVVLDGIPGTEKDIRSGKLNKQWALATTNLSILFTKYKKYTIIMQDIGNRRNWVQGYALVFFL